MSVISWLFNRKPKAPTTTPPVVTPTAPKPPVEPQPAPSGAAPLIKIEGWTGTKWREYDGPLPYPCTDQARVGAVSNRWKKIRVTVLTGKLTFKSPSVSGKHHPKVTGVVRNQVLEIHQSAVVEFWLGPAEPMKGGYEWTTFGVHTVELGEIIVGSAQVMN